MSHSSNLSARIPAGMNDELDSTAEHYGMAKAELLRLMIDAGFAEIDDGGLDALAAKAQNADPAEVSAD